jgi:hypothetical protein
MTKLLACALMLATTSAMAQERVMTCDGAWRPGRVGYCHYNEASVGAEKIFEVCELYERCVLRARVVPDISGPNFTILRVYSVRKASGKDETWAAQVSGAWQNHQPPLGDSHTRHTATPLLAVD